MSDNPFTAVVNSIRHDNKSLIPANYRIGTVITNSPLTIDVAGTMQDGEDLLKNDELRSFEIGDELLLMPIEDEQKYIIICRVVNA